MSERLVSTADVAIVGLGVMGQNLALNFGDHGYSVLVYDSNPKRCRGFPVLSVGREGISTAENAEHLTKGLKHPRLVLMLLPAGDAVDECIRGLVDYLERGDVLIDGGNSHYPDTERRAKELHAQGVEFIGAGISGGEEGALKGPSIMVGASEAAWQQVKPILQAIAAKTEDGTICCDWVGDGAAGHFVKMIHNGIEYGEMQILCEAYHLMRVGLGMALKDIANVFDAWNRGRLASHLVEIARDIVKFTDQDGDPLIEKILDVAEEKGTGKWALATSLDLGQPFAVGASAVLARFMSTLKDQRVKAANVLVGPAGKSGARKQKFLSDLEHAVYASRIVNHAQGYQLMRAGGREHNWHLDLVAITTLWRAGCIIRSALLQDIKQAFDRNPALQNLLLDRTLGERVTSAQAGWRRVVSAAVYLGIPVPSMGSALAYFDSYRTARLPVNLLQAMRDYFGAHGYERVDRARGSRFHRHWTGDGDEIELGRPG